MGKAAATWRAGVAAADDKASADTGKAAHQALPSASGHDFLTVIISHGKFALELKDALEHLMGPQPLVAALDIMASEPLAATRRRLRELLRDLHKTVRGAAKGGAVAAEPGEVLPVVFLSDLFGGTPANLAHAEMKRHAPAWLITGANLPMLVRLMELRGTAPVETVVEEAAAAGRRFIRVESNPA